MRGLYASDRRHNFCCKQIYILKNMKYRVTDILGLQILGGTSLEFQFSSYPLPHFCGSCWVCVSRGWWPEVDLSLSLTLRAPQPCSVWVGAPATYPAVPRASCLFVLGWNLQPKAPGSSPRFRSCSSRGQLQLTLPALCAFLARGIPAFPAKVTVHCFKCCNSSDVSLCF